SDIQTFLVKGQEQAQLLTTQAIATALQDRPELLTELPSKTTTKQQTLLYAYRTDTHLLGDCYAEEWQGSAQPDSFGPNSSADNLDPLSMDLRFLQRGEQLYLLAQVKDHYPVYRHPGYQRLDTSDQLRLTIGDQHFVVTAEGVGSVQVFSTNSRWRYAQPRSTSNPIRGGWVEIDGGYQVELQIPLSLVANAARFQVEALDIDDTVNRTVLDQVSSGTPYSSRLLVHSPELQKIIRGLKRSDRHVWILDRHQQIRAVSNTHDATPNILQRHTSIISRALSGLPALTHYRDGDKEFILAAQPIVDKQGAPLGATVVEMATDEILDLQRATLIKSALASALALAILITGLLFFAYRLTRRIQRLQRQTAQITDPQGRIVNPHLTAETHSNDELGDLAKDMSSLVDRLNQYTQFLERMPRTLRHELSNPLNTISTSLQMIREQLDERQQLEQPRNYLASAERGVNRLNLIINSLAEAASLEESLANEPLTPLNLSQLVRGYCKHLVIQHPINVEVTEADAWIAGSSTRLEQLLDKLVDNAIDFSLPQAPIQIRLKENQQYWLLQIHNQGPAIPDDIKDSMFDSLVSIRTTKAVTGDQNGCHLGIGLFVVKTIASHHLAQVEALNIDNGVCIQIGIPKQSHSA
ncbi:MAG: ATP-binding protein, partial [Motiliproteus sp.]|nr:ATP-binding protein [Motiliproteus sp.]